MSSEIKQYGVTPPIDTSPPTPSELAETEILKQILTDFNLYESEEEAEKREIVLGSLNNLLQQWAKEESMKMV